MGAITKVSPKILPKGLCSIITENANTPPSKCPGGWFILKDCQQKERDWSGNAFWKNIPINKFKALSYQVKIFWKILAVPLVRIRACHPQRSWGRVRVLSIPLKASSQLLVGTRLFFYVLKNRSTGTLSASLRLHNVNTVEFDLPFSSLEMLDFSSPNWADNWFSDICFSCLTARILVPSLFKKSCCLVLTVKFFFD